MIDQILSTIQEHNIKYVELRFTDTLGVEHFMTIPHDAVDKDFLSHVKLFDGSSIHGWQTIDNSDTMLAPDLSTAFIDPFAEFPTLNIRCDIIDPKTDSPYLRDPRSLAKRAEAYLQSTGIGDTCYVGPEPEFFIFDDVRWNTEMSGAFYQIDSEEGAWNSKTEYPQGNTGHRPRVKGGYFPVPPVDCFRDIRSEICEYIRSFGITIESHHHEVATAGQNEITMAFDSLLKEADNIQLFKYIVRNVAHQHGRTATFMPKPLKGDNGSGMHCHQSISKKGKNIFAGDEYAGLSKEALYYIGGIMKHARALNAFTNPTTNSYRRLVVGFEAPVVLAYSAANRSAAIRIPRVKGEKARRIEVRFPDPMANPYLAFSALLMAGLDGIKNKIEPGEAQDEDLFALDDAELSRRHTVCRSLDEALDELDKDRDFLKAGDVFSDDMIDAYINLKRQEINRVRMVPSPQEFDEYYSL